MPELPEVETIRIGLVRRVEGLTVKDIEVRVEKLFKGDIKDVIGVKIIGIRRRAKVLIIDLSNSKSLLIHLKMTGQLVYQSADEKEKVVGGLARNASKLSCMAGGHPQKSYNQPLPHKHTHIIFTFTNGGYLYFNDLRKFGWMMIVKTNEVGEMEFMRELGLEPLDEQFKMQKSKIKMAMQNLKRPIKTLLTDQSFIAGVGNIYSDEILYASKIRPNRSSSSLSNKEIDKLFEVIPIVLKKALKYGGTSDSTYVGVDGERGDYLKVASMYHQKLDPKGHKVTKIKIGGRTAHFCPICQK